MTLEFVVPELEDILRGGDGVEESEYRGKRRSAANSLQGIACTGTEESREAWNILEEAVTQADFRVSLQASQALAYTAASNEEYWNRAVQVYREAVNSEERSTRIAAVDGLRKALDVNTEVTVDCVELFGEAARTGLNSIIEKHDALDSVEEVSADQARRERSSWKALAGLSEAAAHDSEAVREVAGEETIHLFLDTVFSDGAERLF